MSNTAKLNFPGQAKELEKLFEEDQVEWRNFAKDEFEIHYTYSPELNKKRAKLMSRVQSRAERMLQILDEVKAPSISNIGEQGAIAISVLATHTSLKVTQRVLNLFNDLYKLHPDDTYYQSIPAMTDWSRILERKPQTFGTIWMFDNNNEPFLPTVEDFESVNKRRAEYGIEPLHWPKSLAIPISKQPWLRKPISELTMRDPNDEEYHQNADQYLD